MQTLNLTGYRDFRSRIVARDTAELSTRVLYRLRTLLDRRYWHIDGQTEGKESCISPERVMNHAYDSEGTIGLDGGCRSRKQNVWKFRVTGRKSSGSTSP